MHWMQPFKIKPANAAPFEVGIALAPGMRSLRPAAGVAGLMERISGRAGAGAGAQRALSTNAYKNAYSTFHIVQPGHKRQATASNGRFLLMQATGDSQPRQRLDPAGPSLQSGGFDTAPRGLVIVNICLRNGFLNASKPRVCRVILKKAE